VKRHEPRATTAKTCRFSHAIILPQTSRELLMVSFLEKICLSCFTNLSGILGQFR